MGESSIARCRSPALGLVWSTTLTVNGTLGESQRKPGSRCRSWDSLFQPWNELHLQAKLLEQGVAVRVDPVRVSTRSPMAEQNQPSARDRSEAEQPG